MGWLKRVIEHDIFYSFTRSWVIMLAASVTLFIIITSMFAPWITIHDPFNPSSLNLMDAFTPPIWVDGGKWTNPLGTDDQGRDILSTIMFGNRISLLVGFLSVLLAMIIGVTLGTLSGYIGGWLDSLIMRLADVQLTVPPILIALLVNGVAVIGLLEPPGRIARGDIRFEARQLNGLPPETMRQIRGAKIGAIFQDPLTSLNPIYSIGRQIIETLTTHTDLSPSQARSRAVDLLNEVGIPAAERRVDSYPHEFSGGMRQRVVIALAICCNPRLNIAEPIRAFHLAKNRSELQERVSGLLLQVGLSPSDGEKYPHEFSGGQRQRISIARALSSHPDFLVCDEPTSALDVSVQAQILNLMKELQRRLGLTYSFISRNLAVVNHISDHVGVMYLGRLCEVAPKGVLFKRPQHPYTRLLLDTIPDLDLSGRRRQPVTGEVPNPIHPPSGCAFHPRCFAAYERCRVEKPLPRLSKESIVACHAVEKSRM